MNVIDLFKRLRLKRRGFSCGKVRRRPDEHEWLHSLECGWEWKISIMVAFVFGLWMLLPDIKSSFASVYPKRPWICTLVIFAAAQLHLWINHPNTFRSNRRFLLLFGGIFFQLLIVKACCVMFVGDDALHLVIIPHALIPMMLAVLLGRNLALMATLYISFWGWLLVPPTEAFTFLIFSKVIGFVGVYATDRVSKRSKLLRVGIIVGACSLGLVLAMGFTTQAWQPLCAAFFSGVAAGILVSGSLPMLESFFKITTDMKWREWSDLNHPLLKELSLLAPGTMQHSLQVANIAAAAAEAIGANAELCRACAYFHDIGKMSKPQYFIENSTGEPNPHDELRPSMSALIIMSHVKEGVDLAMKHHLDDTIIDVIRQHHGNSVIAFFFHKASEEKRLLEIRARAGEIDESEVPVVLEEHFRYPGPRPQTKESAILSLADSLESMSRCWQQTTPQKIAQKVDELIRSRIMDGQLSDCDLTMKEIFQIQQAFTTILKSILHTRIEYPKIESKSESRRSDSGRVISEKIRVFPSNAA